MRGDNQRDEEGGEQAQREVRERVHLVGVGEVEPGGAENDEENIHEADDVPDDEEAVESSFREGNEDQNDGEARDDDVANAAFDGEGVGQFAPAIEDEKIEADEAREVELHERAGIERVHPGAERRDAEVGRKQNGDEAEEDRGDGGHGEALQEEKIAGGDGGKKPEPEGEADEERGAGHGAASVEPVADAGERGVGALTSAHFPRVAVTVNSALGQRAPPGENLTRAVERRSV